jgi:hypothetical protein
MGERRKTKTPGEEERHERNLMRGSCDHRPGRGSYWPNWGNTATAMNETFFWDDDP